MKKIIMIAVVVLVFIESSFAQIKFRVNEEVNIEKLYVGMLAGPQFSIDSLSVRNYGTIRFGAMGTYQPYKWFALKSFAMYQFEPGNEEQKMVQFWAKITPCEKLSIEFGNMATLVTEQRPHPVSGDGQFETSSEAQIPGMAMNAKAKFEVNSNIKAGIGVAVRNNKPEYSAMVEYKKIKISGWSAEKNTNDTIHQSGIALTINFDRLYSTLVYKQGQIISDILVVKISKDKTISFYADNGYNLNTKKLTRGEYGFLKSFDSQYIKGLFGIGYQYETRNVVGYIFIHL